MTKLHAERCGDPARPALVFVHPFGTDGHFWNEAVADLSNDYDCLVPDLQNAGRSPRPGRPVLPTEHVADLAELVRDVGYERVVYIGCAIGAMLAVLAACSGPDLAAGLVMANPGLRNADSMKPILRQRIANVRASGMSALLPSAADRAFHTLPKDARYASYVKRFAAQDPEAYALSILGFFDVDITEALPRLGCPVLLLPGGQDILMAPGSADAIAALAPHCEIIAMQDYAHFIPFQAPERFVAAIRPFLSRCLPDRRAD